MQRPSVYESAGGEAAFLALARAHHERCLADPVLNHPFSHGTHPQHIERLAGYWGEVFGGPPSYSDGGGGHSAMLMIHSGQGAESDLDERFVACFTAAMDDARLPADPPLRQVLRSYLEWAVADVMACSPPESRVPAGLEMPRWGWAGPITAPVLRPSTSEDAPAVAAIWHRGWRDGHLGHVPDELLAIRSEASFHERAAGRVAGTTVATVDGTVAGFVMVVGDEIEQVYVRSDHRGSGVASALLAEAERQVAANGHDRAWLAVVAGNARARRFHERQGFTDEGPFDYPAAGGVMVPCHRYVRSTA
jgi:truncated hemoglobin YjbI/GNAT superfamily N-acetyltransferase